MNELTPEGGVQFRGTLQELENGKWRASGVISLDKKSEVLEELVEARVYDSREEARAYLHAVAKSRGFKKLSIKG